MNNEEIKEELITEECSKCNKWTPHKDTEESIFHIICGTEFKEPIEHNEV